METKNDDKEGNKPKAKKFLGISISLLSLFAAVFAYTWFSNPYKDFNEIRTPTQAEKSAFVKSCKSGGNSDSYCNCLVEAAYSTFAPKELANVLDNYQVTGVYNPKFTKIATKCSTNE